MTVFEGLYYCNNLGKSVVEGQLVYRENTSTYGTQSFNYLINQLIV